MQRKQVLSVLLFKRLSDEMRRPNEPNNTISNSVLFTIARPINMTDAALLGIVTAG